jgi:hypothetical protein
MVVGLLLLRIQKHSLDGGNRVPELLKLIFETPEQSNLLASKRSRTRNDTRSNVKENCLRHLFVGGESIDMLKPAVEVVMGVVGSVEL